jgi:hypothetical protein
MEPLWRGAADVVIEPDVAGFDYDDFKRADQLIRVGELAMRGALPQVRKWLEAPSEQDNLVPAHTMITRPVPMAAD